MNKIILQFGLLVFFFSIIYFAQKGFELEKVLLNSFAVFIIITVMLSLMTIGLIKAINKNTSEKYNHYTDELAGNNNE
ncbi:MAG: hypothetical protein HYS25_08565 [Ignavibacteriales bacterium]|nr:hypothetical protein [Ignavibacteriales bacterium]